MYKAKSLDDIQSMLDSLPMAEFRFDTVREDALTMSGALRTISGQNIIEPAAESASMIVGLKPSIKFLTEAPMIVKQLLDAIRNNEKTPKTPKED